MTNVKCQMFRVFGHSMYPLLRHGDVVLVKKKKHYRVGDIVVAEHPFRKQLIVKKIEKIFCVSNGVTSDRAAARELVQHRDALPSGQASLLYELEGLDAIESEDSRSFGAISADKIIGKVECPAMARHSTPKKSVCISITSVYPA